MSDYRDRLLGFGIRGTQATNTTTVPHEERAGVAGTITEHRDGRQDATVYPDTAHLRQKVHKP